MTTNTKADTYKVLWIDDQCHSDHLREFIFEARTHNIELICFISNDLALPFLEKNLAGIDAIILDGLFFKYQTQEAGTEDLKALSEAVKKINELKSKKVVPYFILSGQTRLDNDETFSDTYGEHFRKGKHADHLALFGRIKEEADKNIFTQIRHKYSEVFKACNDELIDSKAAEELIYILKRVESSDELTNDLSSFNSLRKVIEYVFRAANKFGLLDDKCLPRDIVNLSRSLWYLSGKEVVLAPSVEVISCAKSHLPGIMATNLSNMLAITNAASHTEGIEKEQSKTNLSIYQNVTNSPYLLFSLTFQVMDLVLWFKNYIHENSDIELNKSLWNSRLPEGSASMMPGTVINKNVKGYAFFKPRDGTANIFIPASLVNIHHLENNNTIEVTTEETQPGRPQVKTLNLLN